MEKWWPKITDKKSALNAAKFGGNAGFIFAVFYVIGLISFVSTNSFEFAEQTISSDDRVGTIIGIVIGMLLVVFWSIRVRTGRGYISSILLVFIFIIEIAAKITSVSVGFYWYLIYLAIFLALIGAVRGTWAYRKYKDDPDVDVFD